MSGHTPWAEIKRERAEAAANGADVPIRPDGANRAAETVYTVQRACRDCGQDLPAGSAPQRRYCDRDRTRRRALTFIRKGEAILAAIEVAGG